MVALITAACNCLIIPYSSISVRLNAAILKQSEIDLCLIVDISQPRREYLPAFEWSDRGEVEDDDDEDDDDEFNLDVGLEEWVNW
jgi:hypothetical protein